MAQNIRKPLMMSFDIENIRLNFLEVQERFHEINNKIHCHRDPFDDVVMHNLLDAYQYINEQLASNPGKHPIDLDPMLELNAIVLMGTDLAQRLEYNGSLKETKNKVVKCFPNLKKWYERHVRTDDDPYKIAAGLFVRVLAAPQFFVDGNHRTGSMIANYHLLLAGQKPFILTADNAVEFFNLASDVKFKKTDIRSKFKRATGWHDEVSRMTDFLKNNALAFSSPLVPKSPSAVSAQNSCSLGCGNG